MTMDICITSTIVEVEYILDWYRGREAEELDASGVPHVDWNDKEATWAEIALSARSCAMSTQTIPRVILQQYVIWNWWSGKRSLMKTEKSKTWIS